MGIDSTRPEEMRLPQGAQKFEKDPLFPKEKMETVRDYLLQHGEERAAEARSRGSVVEWVIDKGKTKVSTLRIHGSGEVEIVVQTKDKSVTFSLGQQKTEYPGKTDFLKGLEKAEVTLSPAIAEELFQYISAHRAEMVEKAKESPFGFVYVRAADDFSRAIQFNADGGVYIHLNKTKAGDPEIVGGQKKVRWAYDVDQRRAIMVGKLLLNTQENQDALRKEVGFLDRLRDKRGIAQKLSLVQVDGKTQGKHFFIQPRYNCGDLFFYKLKRIPEKEQLQITLDLLAGMKALEEAGIVHRDIKPENIFLHRDENGNMHAYIADFGLALDSSEPQDTIAGTPGYLAPETVETGVQNAGCDMWALGLTIGLMRNFAPPQEDLERDPIGNLCYDDLLKRNPDERLTATQAWEKYHVAIEKRLAALA